MQTPMNLDFFFKVPPAHVHDCDHHLALEVGQYLQLLTKAYAVVNLRGMTNSNTATISVTTQMPDTDF